MLQSKTIGNFASIAKTFSELECFLAIRVFKDFNSRLYNSSVSKAFPNVSIKVNPACTDEWIACMLNSIHYCKRQRFLNFLLHKSVNFTYPDGNWAAWASWSSCTKSCSGGKEVRSRTCTDPATNYGGKDCTGETSQERTCNTHACTGTHCLRVLPMHCKYG